MDAQTNPWRDAFEAFKANDTAAAMGAGSREEAFKRFEAHGLPTKRDEYWKYTPVRDLTPEIGISTTSAADAFADVDAYRIVFVDGRIDHDRSDREALEKVADVPTGEATWISTVYAALQARPIEGAQKQVDRPFADLNMAMATDVLLVEKGASATLLESGAGALTTGAEFVIEDGATLNHLRAQTEVADKQFTALYASIGAEANFKTFTLAADGALIRNETQLTMAGENGNGHIAAGVMGRGKALIDNKAVFQGKIYVKEHAQKTDGYQISQSVLLSEGAEFNAKPELEIYADDVMCSHGSTTGALDETALFYLRSRGVPQKKAEAMLVAAFVDEAILEIADEALQDIVRKSVDAWMAERAAG